ncbi:MAG: choice-of-anchor D domain-containing protein, partial [Candidatus Cloacimonetes bacterium]|nr:choice-of-anchor D domain-containing protein [Candidatus Cloacimonadota bacterium]
MKKITFILLFILIMLPLNTFADENLKDKRSIHEVTANQSKIIGKDAKKGEREKLKKKDTIQKQIGLDSLSNENKKIQKSKEKIENQIDVWNSFNEKEKLQKLEMLISEITAKKEKEINHQNIILIDSLMKSAEDLKNKPNDYDTILKFFQKYNYYENYWQKPDRDTPKRQQETKIEKDGQKVTITIRPHNSTWWTGSVYKDILGLYVNEDKDVKAGDNWVGTKWRSYARFDIDDIPDNADVISIELKAWTRVASSSSNHRLEVKKLTVDPLYTGGSTLYNDIGNGAAISSLWDAMCYPNQYHTITLYSSANQDLEDHLSSGYWWWAVGFQEYQDNDGWGQFDGYDWEEPYCIVTYEIYTAPDICSVTPVNTIPSSEPYQYWDFEVNIDALCINGTANNVYINITDDQSNDWGTFGPYDFVGFETWDNRVFGTWDYNWYEFTSPQEVCFTFYAYNTLGYDYYVRCIIVDGVDQDPYITLTPSSHDFGNQLVNTPSPYYSFTLENTGGGTATGSVYLTGSNANQFEVHTDDQTFALIHNETKPIRVRFKPTSTGYKSATLKADGDPPCNNATATVSGTGIDDQYPDLIVQSFNIPDETQSPSTIYASGSVKNQGDVSSNPCNLGFYLSINSQWDPSDTNLNADISIGQLNAGETQSFSNHPINIPSGLNVNQTYYIIAYVDDGEIIDEGDNENNNTNSQAITIIPPDIIAGNLKITGDNISGSAPNYTIVDNIQIGHKDLTGYLLNIPNGTVSVNTSNETITVTSGCSSFNIPVSGWSWDFNSAASWSFNCQNATAMFQANLYIGVYKNSKTDIKLYSSQYNLNFWYKSINALANFTAGVLANLLNINVNIDLDDTLFSFGLETGVEFDLPPVTIGIAQCGLNLIFNVLETSIEFDADIGNLLTLKLIDIDSAGFSFAPLGSVSIGLKWDVDGDSLRFTRDTGISIPLTPVLREQISDDDYYEMVEKGIIVE